jgi:RimJ/RimL family protein N-acetyltransferase
MSIYFSDEEEEEEEDDNNGMVSWWTPPISGRDPTLPPPRLLQLPLRRQAEVDIMIADTEYRGRGLGQEAVTLMMTVWGQTHELDTILCRRFMKRMWHPRIYSKTSLALLRYNSFMSFSSTNWSSERTNQEMMDYLSTMNHGSYDLQTFACPLLLPE